MLVDKLNHKELASDIFLFTEAIPKELCKQVIDIVEKYPAWEEAKIGGNDKTIANSKYRNNKVDYLTTRFGQNSDLYYAHNILGYYLKKSLEDLNDIYAFNDKFYSKPVFSCINNDEGFQILKYEKGEYYRPHLDASSENKRVLSLIIYLNSDYDGGETSFLRQKIKVKGNTGDILIFPSNYCFPHTAEEVKSGIKYTMVTWFV